MSKCLMMMVLCAIGASTANAASPAPITTDSAVVACETGKPWRRSTHAADACWAAFRGAMAANRYDAALNFAKVGCEHYRRADYCAMVSHVGADDGKPVVRRVAINDAKAGDEIRRALMLVTAIDVEDAESGVNFRRALQ